MKQIFDILKHKYFKFGLAAVMFALAYLFEYTKRKDREE